MQYLQSKSEEQIQEIKEYGLDRDKYIRENALSMNKRSCIINFRMIRFITGVLTPSNFYKQTNTHLQILYKVIDL